jgi:dGTPase
MHDLFNAYLEEPRQLPTHILKRCDEGESVARVIADYIAGMTDRFAVEEHAKLFDPPRRA